jgi:hypothetical protein
MLRAPHGGAANTRDAQHRGAGPFCTIASRRVAYVRRRSADHPREVRHREDGDAPFSLETFEQVQ